MRAMEKHPFALISLFCYFTASAASPCDSTIPGKWAGFGPSGQPFGDAYALTRSSPSSLSWAASSHSPHDSWTNATGLFSSDYSSTTISFNNGVKDSGTVSPACDKITFKGGSSWALLPPPPPQPPACAAITSPAPCGQLSDSAERCLQKGCCYDPTSAYPCFHPGGNAVPITHVHVIQASHFDAGFAYTIKDVLMLWWYTHFPRATALGLAIDANATLSASIGLRFTAQMWLLEMFFNCPPGVPGLRCPTAAEEAAVSNAINKGWITWHAFPFNSEAEGHTARMLQAGVGMAHALDDKFGLPHKATMSQRDVPGTTRAVIPVLAQVGVTAFSIGVNGASTPPFVPRVFLWKDEESGMSMPQMVHPYGYGSYDYEGAVILPGLAHAMVFAWRGDNAGPPDNVGEIEGDFKTIRGTFPGAAVFSSTFDNFTSHFVGVPALLAQLPVVTAEMGDTWMHGAASEPIRCAFFKRASNLLSQCVDAGKCVQGDATIANFTRFLIKCGEHTWGKDIKGFLHDTTHWTNAELQAQLAAKAPNFVDVVASWQEQRDWCAGHAIEALQIGGHALAGPVAATLADLFPSPSQPDPVALGFAPFAPGAVYQGSAAWALAFDGVTGAVALLQDKRQGGVTWVNASLDGSALGWVHYTALSSEDYSVFTGPEPNGYYPFDSASPDWFQKDFGECAEHRMRFSLLSLTPHPKLPICNVNVNNRQAQCEQRKPRAL